jgi:scyllo-inositol 2-dehydrogenase (NADP+)
MRAPRTANAEAQPIRVGLIGFGLAGAVFHAPLISAIPRMRLVSIVTRNAERRNRARSRYPDAEVLDSSEDVWKRSGQHDLVVLASPNRTHVPFALDAIEAGLSVVIDKPLAGTAEEGRRVAEAGRAAGRLVSVFQNRRWDGDFLTLRRLIGDGALGRVMRFESRFERWRPELAAHAWREAADSEEVGGLLFDLGSHLVDQAVSLFGPPSEVYAELHNRREGSAVDDDSFVALLHPHGVRSHLWMSAVAAKLGPRFRVLGLGGAYEKFGLDPQEDALAAGELPGSADWGREPPDRWGTLTDGRSDTRVETEPGAYHLFYQGVADALDAGGPPPVDAMEAAEVLGILEAARESVRTRRVVRLTEPGEA